MRKAIKIGGAVLAFLAAAALVIFIFFPGLPTYMKLKSKYKNMDKHIAEFEKVSVPSDFKSYNIRGVSFKAPADWKLSDTKSSLRSPDEDSMIMVIKSNVPEEEKLLSESGYDCWESYDFTKDEYEGLFRKLDIDVPEYDLNTRMLWMTKDELQLKDCIRLRGKDMDIFKDLADIKENAWDTENSWSMDTDTYKAFVGQILTNGFGGGMWTVTFYKNDKSQYRYFVTLKCPDRTTAKQIVSSMILNDKET